LLQEHGVAVDVLTTEYPGHAMHLAADIARRTENGYSHVLCVGGDGTAHETANGLAYGCVYAALTARSAIQRTPTLGLIPCGSGNCLAFNLGILTVDDAINAVLINQPRHMDVLEITHPEDRSIPSLAQQGDAAAATQPASASASASSGENAASRYDAMNDEIRAASTISDAVAKLSQRVLYSVNMVGWAMSTSVMEKANDLRWCGGAQYNCAAYMSLINNACWVGGVEFVDPPAPVEISARTFSNTRAIADGSVDIHTMDEATAAKHNRDAATASDAAGAVAGTGTDASAVGVDEHGEDTSSGTGPLIPIQPFPTDARAWAINQFQMTTYMGSRMAFCPFASMDDGFMDICGVLAGSRAQLIQVMEAAKVNGRHVLGAKNGKPIASAPVRYCRAREVIVRPLDATQMGQWSVGTDIQFTAAGDGVASIPSTNLEKIAAAQAEHGVEVAATQKRAADIHSIDIGIDARAPIPSKIVGSASRVRHVTVDPSPLIGPRTVNVDGELTGWSPMRLKVLPRTIALLCAPHATGKPAAK
jgi:diacylglycerol kinase family enzyme